MAHIETVERYKEIHDTGGRSTREKGKVRVASQRSSARLPTGSPSLAHSHGSSRRPAVCSHPKEALRRRQQRQIVRPSMGARANDRGEVASSPSLAVLSAGASGRNTIFAQLGSAYPAPRRSTLSTLSNLFLFWIWFGRAETAEQSDTVPRRVIWLPKTRQGRETNTLVGERSFVLGAGGES
jgi:hypothetical protein